MCQCVDVLMSQCADELMCQCVPSAGAFFAARAYNT